jgi:hypothetical protein
MRSVNFSSDSNRLDKNNKKGNKSKPGLFELAFDDNLLNATEGIESASEIENRTESIEGYKSALFLTEKLEQYLLDN